MCILVNHASPWEEATNDERRRVAEMLVERVTLHPDRLELEVKSGGVTAFKEQIDNENENRNA